MFRILSTRARLSFGLASIVVTVLYLGLSLGLVPDAAKQLREQRAEWCETFALGVAAIESTGNVSLLRDFLESQATAAKQVQSVGLRDSRNRLIAASLEHESHWNAAGSTADHISIPLHQGSDLYGTVEVAFQSVGSNSAWYQWLTHPWTLMSVLLGGGCIVGFYAYLGMMLRQLDPSQTVPTRVRSALDNLTEGLLVIDRRCRIVLANAAFARFSGETQERLMGRKPEEFGWTGPDGEEVSEFPWMKTLESNQTFIKHVLQLQRPGQDTLVFHVNCSPVGKDNQALGVMISFEDITLLESNKRELSAAKSAAEDASRAKSSFLANMSHEIRTPMNAILGFTELLLRGEVSHAGEQREFLNTIHRSGTHLLELINDILDLSKIEADKLTIERTLFSPCDVVLDVHATLGVRARQKGIQLTVAASSQLPESINSDAARFRQVITNLVGNAVKFTDRGSVTVEMDLQVAGNESWLRVRVADTGIGMEPHQVERLFQPFTQADASITRRFGGTGLGLSISKRLVEAMGGRMTVASRSGQGSVFEVVVPTGDLKGIPLRSLEHLLADRKSAVTTKVSTLERLPPAHVLIVDDGEPNRRFARLVLTRAGCIVAEATDGQEALAALAKHRFQLVLMDMQMPVLDGYQATRRIRQLGNRVPIVALTANAMAEDRAKCDAAGCNDFVAKPIHIDQLLQVASRFLRPQFPDWDPGDMETVQSSAAAAVDTRLETDPTAYCQFDLADDELRDIAESFLRELESRWGQAQRRLVDADWVALAGFAHWLKGAGGTCGFPVFSEPAKQLEQSAKANQANSCEQWLQQIKLFADRAAHALEMHTCVLNP